MDAPFARARKPPGVSVIREQSGEGLFRMVVPQFVPLLRRAYTNPNRSRLWGHRDDFHRGESALGQEVLDMLPWRRLVITNLDPFAPEPPEGRYRLKNRRLSASVAAL